MMRWQPDTCVCKFEFEVTNLPNGGAERRLHKVLNQCSYHTGSDEETLAAAQADNRHKNVIVNRASKLADKPLAWRFDEHRNLVVSGDMTFELRGVLASLDRVRVE